jgi:protein farnesyltransferase/geranylgeranyltransferase type-1 subunit alpha
MVEWDSTGASEELPDLVINPGPSSPIEHSTDGRPRHHRQLLMTRLGDPTGEAAFLRSMFERDSKNYHVWSYRQWLVRRFDLWDTELPDVEELIDEDVRNNSAWNHRYFLVFGRGKDVENEVVVREIEYDSFPLTPFFHST